MVKENLIAGPAERSPIPPASRCNRERTEVIGDFPETCQGFYLEPGNIIVFMCDVKHHSSIDINHLVPGSIDEHVTRRSYELVKNDTGHGTIERGAPACFRSPGLITTGRHSAGDRMKAGVSRW